jgi:hypothetical protein
MGIPAIPGRNIVGVPAWWDPLRLRRPLLHRKRNQQHQQLIGEGPDTPGEVNAA